MTNSSRRFFFKYWLPSEAEIWWHTPQEIERGWSNQYEKRGLKKGDVIWFASAPDGVLQLIGRLDVDRLLTPQQTRRRFGNDVADATYAVAASGKARRSVHIDLTAHLHDLAFVTEPFWPVADSSGRVNPKAFQALRELSLDGHRALERISGLVDAGGPVPSAGSSSLRPSLHCRICFNTDGWMRPSGDARNLEQRSYVSENGFGHEEWLLNFSRLADDGTKFGFLQPLNDASVRKKFAGQPVDIALYTIAEGGARAFVAVIHGCGVLSDEEADEALALHRDRGWLKEMKGDVRRVNGNASKLDDEGPMIFNVAFRREDVEFFDPPLPVGDEFKARQTARYKPLGDPLPIAPREPTTLEVRKLRRELRKPKSTAIRTRVVSGPIVYDPLHDKLQNALYEILVERHGVEAVDCEVGGVDVLLEVGAETVFYEVKGMNTARECIRHALGQLLEYGFWPPARLPTKIIVVGPVVAPAAAVTYLGTLRDRWQLPIAYQHLDHVRKQLGEES